MKPESVIRKNMTIAGIFLIVEGVLLIALYTARYLFHLF